MTVCLSSSRKSKAPGNYRVLLGSTQLYQHTQHTWEVSGIRIITHPDFEKLHPFGSDSAMLQLLFPVIKTLLHKALSDQASSLAPD